MEKLLVEMGGMLFMWLWLLLLWARWIYTEDNRDANESASDETHTVKSTC